MTPKLDFKERKNLYEKIRMEKEEKQEWEEGLAVKMTPDRKKRIECFKEILDFVEDDEWAEDEEEILQNALARINNEEINEKTRRMNEKFEKGKNCVRCGEWTKKNLLQESNSLAYCPYCWEVCFGHKNENWPPKIGGNEDRKGLHRG